MERRVLSMDRVYKDKKEEVGLKLLTKERKEVKRVR